MLKSGSLLSNKFMNTAVLIFCSGPLRPSYQSLKSLKAYRDFLLAPLRADKERMRQGLQGTKKIPRKNRAGINNNKSDIDTSDT